MSQLHLTQARSWIDSNESLKNSSQTLHILYSICHNIVGHPSDPKLRMIKLDNPKVKANILDVEGAIDLLYLCGFEMDSNNNSNCLILKTGNFDVKVLEDLGNLFHSYCSEDVKSPRPQQPHHAETTAIPPTIRHRDLFHHDDHHHTVPVTTTTTRVGDFNDEEYNKKQHELEERKKQLAEEKRIKKEEAMRIKNQSKLDRKEKHDEDEYEHGLNIPQHHVTHHSGQSSSSNPFYSGMTTYKDINNQQQ